MRSFYALFWVVLMCSSMWDFGSTSSRATKGQQQNGVTKIDVTQRQDNQVTSAQSPAPTPRGNQKSPRPRRKPTRRERCCHLGRRVAKVGLQCQYVTTIASLRPDYQHYHQLKSKIWMKSSQDANGVKVRTLRKCKRFKAFYEKCCFYEARMIDEDLKRMIKRLKEFLKKIKKGKKRSRKDKITGVRATGTR